MPAPDANPLAYDALVAQYLDFCRVERNLSPRTLEAYGSVLHRFLAWQRARRPEGTWGDVTVPDLRAWLAAFAHRAAGTRQFLLVALRRCFDFAVAEGLLSSSPARRIGVPFVPKRLPVVPTEADLARLFRYLDSATDWLAVRDRALLATAYGAGLRASELVGLNVDVIDFEEQTARVMGKGRKPRRAILPSRTLHALAAYLPLRDQLAALQPGEAERDALFFSASGHRLTRAAANSVFKRRAAEAGLAGRVYLHGLRHAYCSHLLDHGAPIQEVSEALGHSSVMVTKVYTHIAPAKLRQTVETWHPLGGAYREPAGPPPRAAREAPAAAPAEDGLAALERQARAIAEALASRDAQPARAPAAGPRLRLVRPPAAE